MNSTLKPIPQLKPIEKCCRVVLSERDFKEHRLNYWTRGGIHVETRSVSGHERWEITDYTWRNGHQEKSTLSGVGAAELGRQLDFKIQQHFPERRRGLLYDHC
jgi:hypothetical protein